MSPETDGSEKNYEIIRDGDSDGASSIFGETEISQELYNKILNKYELKKKERFNLTKSELYEIKKAITANNVEKIQEILDTKLKSNKENDNQIGPANKNEQADLARKTLIEEDLRKKGNNPDMETLLLGTKSEKLKEIGEKIMLGICDKLSNTGKFDMNNPDHKKYVNNIVVGITQQILNNPATDDLMGLSSIFNSFIKDPSSLLLGDMKDKGKTLEDKVKILIDDSMKPIIELIKTKDLIVLDGFLSNPEKIQKYKEGDNIDGVTSLNEFQMVEYLMSSNVKLAEIDKLIKTSEEGKKTFLKIIYRNDIIGETAFSVLKWFLGTFLGNFIAGFFGFKNAQEAITCFGEERIRTISTNNLKSYGASFNEEGKKIFSQNNPEIQILKDKDLSNIDHEKLTKFFDYSKKRGLNTYLGDKFWLFIFSGEKQDMDEVDPDDQNKKIKKSIFLPKINTKHFTYGKPNDEFFKELNGIEELNNQVSMNSTINNQVVTPIPISKVAPTDGKTSLVTPTVMPPVIKESKENLILTKEQALNETLVNISNGSITKDIEYSYGNPLIKEKISIDYDNQKIQIGNQIFKIELKGYYSLNLIKIVGGDVHILAKNSLKLPDKTEIIPKSIFSSYINTLITKGEVILGDAGKITKIQV